MLIKVSFFDTDFHCHVLPGIDDGASDIDVSMQLIHMQAAQGVRHIVATPHFRRHEQSVAHFLEKRQAAYETVMANAFDGMPDIALAAEVALEHNLCETEGLALLANSHNNTLLLELPLFDRYHKWMSEEIEEVAYRTKMQIIIAHLDRYVDLYDRKDYNELLSLPDVIFQCNLSAFERFKSRKLVKQLIKDEQPLLFGTDCHNLTSRKPNFDLLAKNLKHYEPSVLVQQLPD